MIVTTTDTVPGHKVTTTHGIVRGYTELSTESRERAEKRMKKEARAMGADAIVAVRFMTGSDSDGADEVLAYGTAVSLG
nr:heavy metal-binding domain-containing protein [Halohasta salina]